jgi:protein-disulfide isomerase
VNEYDSSTGRQARRAWRSRVGGVAGALALAACLLAPTGCAQGSDAEHPGEVLGAVRATALYADIPQQGVTLGDPAAPVELVELSDLQCPFCSRFAGGALPAIVARYVRTGRVRLTFHNLPILGEDSRRAARLALAISLQDRMFQFIDVFFANQGREGSGYVTEPFLRRIAGAVPGVDMEQAMRDVDSPVVTAKLDRARSLAGDLRLRGVPAFLIGRTGETPQILHIRSLTDPASFFEAIEALLPAR